MISLKATVFSKPFYVLYSCDIISAKN